VIARVAAETIHHRALSMSRFVTALLQRRFRGLFRQVPRLHVLHAMSAHSRSFMHDPT
jgi:hypothetical protein